MCGTSYLMTDKCLLFICSLLCSYIERYGLASPCDNVETVLKSIALHLGKTQRVKVLTGTGALSLLFQLADLDQCGCHCLLLEMRVVCPAILWIGSESGQHSMMMLEIKHTQSIPAAVTQGFLYTRVILFLHSSHSCGGCSTAAEPFPSSLGRKCYCDGPQLQCSSM